MSSYLYLFVLNSAQSSGEKATGNVTANNYLKESLSSMLCFIIQGKGSSGKGLIPKLILLRMVIRNDWVSCLHARNEIGRVFASNGKHFFCFNKFFAGKGAFMNSSCCVIFELNKFAYVKCDTRGHMIFFFANFDCHEITSFA